MSDRDEFEKWLSEFLEFDVKDLERTRYTDDDGMQGYIGLEKEGHTEYADDLASMAIQAWQAARAQGVEAVAEIHKFGYGRRRTTVRHIRDLAKYPEGTKLYLSHEQQG